MDASFHANCVAVEDMEDFWLVGFADDEFDTQNYLTLQRAFEDDEQDIRLGMNTYHVERNGQAWSCYGGIEKCCLYPDRIQVHFSADSAANMGGVSSIEITFAMKPAEFERLEHRLQKILAGCSILEVRA
jgi:hypothetical protein